MINHWVGKLLDAGMTMAKDIDPDKAPRVYAFALNRVSATILRETVEKLIRGEMMDFNPSFLPRPAELAQHCRRRMAELRSARMHVREKIQTIEDVAALKRSTKTEASKSRVRELVEWHHQQNAEANKTEDEKLKISTDEQRDYWKRISDLKDKGELTPLQHAFREQVGQQLGDQ